ncbi:MAG: hypothetical protein U9R79_10365 [Armatimonadota bacterium]|nr:hypothetical protein [Armatimonadota bacterium]
MNLYEIILPCTDNDGREIEPEKYEETLRELIHHFGGAEFERSSFSGYWQDEPDLYEDDNVLMRVEASDDSDFWSHYKEVLKTRFRQEEIRIRVIPLTIV